MPEAVLRIKTEGGAEARELITALERAVGGAQQRMARGARASQQRIVRDTVQATGQQVGAYRAAAVVIERQEQLLTRSKLRELAKQGEAARRFATLYADAHRRATAAIEAEVGKRGNLSDRERRQVETLALAMVSEHEQAERRRTAATRREAAQREQAARREQQAERGRQQVGRDRAGRLLTLGGAAASVATSVHGQMQDARAQRAHADRLLGGAARGAGMSAQEEAVMRTRVRAFAHDKGINYNELAQALREGQEGGQALEGNTPEERSRALESALETAREANATGTNMGQFLTARGRLGAAGLQGESLQRALRFSLGAALAGNVEVDQIIRQGLPGATQLMQQRVAALGPGATDEQKMTARETAFRESVALQEVSARSGMQPGNTANVLSSVQNFLNTPRRQEMMLNNIRNAERRVNTHTPEGRAQAQRYQALRDELFERDPTRTGNAMRMRADFASNPLALTERLAAATGGNANAAANLFAGGGQGNPQALLANQRRLFAFLGSQGGAVREMMGSTVTDQQMADFQQRTETDDLSNLTRNEEARVAALADNTGVVRNLSDRIVELNAQFPILSTAITGMAGAVASAAGGKAALGRVLAPAAGAASTGGVAAVAAGVGRGVLRAALGAPMAIASMLQIGGSYGGVEQDEVVRQRRERAAWEEQASRLGAQARAEGRAPPTAAEIGAAVAASLRSSPIVASIDPHAAVHLDTERASANSTRSQP